MANGRNSVSMVVKKNQITEVVTKHKEFENNIKNLLAKPLSVMADAAFVTSINGALGAAFSVVLETIGIHLCSVFPIPQDLKIVPGRRLINARNVAVLVGVDNGLKCVLKTLRGKDDVQARMAAGLGAGVLFAMIHLQDPKIVISYGVLFALGNAGVFKNILGIKSIKPFLYFKNSKN